MGVTPRVVGELERGAQPLVPRRELLEERLGVGHHRPELVHRELATVQTRPGRRVQQRPALGGEQHQRDRGEHRGQNQEHQPGDEDVEEALEVVADAMVGGVVQRQQRHPLQVLEPSARAGAG